MNHHEGIWHSFLDLEIAVCHNARKFDIDVPIHNGHHCVHLPPPACFSTHDDHEFSSKCVNKS